MPDRPRPVTHFVIASATPVRLIVRLRMKAAMMISRIMPLTRAVLMKQVRSTSQLSLPECQTKNSAAITPSAALSVVVAMPKYRLPITMPNTTSGGTRNCSVRRRSASGTLSSRLTLPLITLEIQIHSMKQPVSSSPGMMPAMNSLPIEVLVSEP